MARKLKSDKLLFLATLLLLCVSVVMVYSASAVLAVDRFEQPPYYFLFKQVTWAALGVCLLSLAMRVDYRSLRQPLVIWSGLGLSLVALVAVFFGPDINGTRRWLGIGGIGVQPSELAKVVVIIFTAMMLEQRMHKIDEVRYALGPIAGVTALVCGLIVLEPDFGTAFTLLLIVSVMVFAAGLRYRYIIGTALVMAPVLAVILASADYRRRRLMAFLDPWADPLGDGFQIIQSQIAVGTGGVVGQGLMGGVQKLFYLPAPHTDFIYAVIAEETGLVGASAVLVCFGVIVWRGLRISAAAPDAFGSFLALGLTMMVAFQAFVNISVVLGLMPTKGIPLPFVSSGGSSLLVSLLGMGILLNVSQHASSNPG
jgi:cell division protein FtsW